MARTHGPVNAASYMRAMTQQLAPTPYMPTHVLARSAERYEDIPAGNDYYFHSRVLPMTGPKKLAWTEDLTRMYQLCRDQVHFFAPYYQVPTSTLPVYYMRMWQQGWTFDALHQKYIRYQAYPWPPLYERIEQFHMWNPIDPKRVEEYADEGWIFNYVHMRWDHQQSDTYIDFEPYPDVPVKHYPPFELPADSIEVQLAQEDGFFYASTPPYGQYRTSDTAEDHVRTCQHTGIIP